MIMIVKTPGSQMGFPAAARAEGLVGTGVDVFMNPVVLNDVDASTLVLTAVADDDMLLLSTCVDGVGVAVLMILEVADDVNISVVAALVASKLLRRTQR